MVKISTGDKLPKKTGIVIKSLCCICLGEKFTIDDFGAKEICNECGAINQGRIRLYVSVGPDRTRQELGCSVGWNPIEDIKAMEEATKNLVGYPQGKVKINKNIIDYLRGDNYTKTKNKVNK